jgi:hypothetical protein
MRPLMHDQSEGWQIIVVRVPDAASQAGARRKLEAMERWLAEHHRPVALFNADGRPRSETVCLALPLEQSDRALAWRTFCGEIGLAGHMVQWRAAPYRPAEKARSTEQE